MLKLYFLLYYEFLKIGTFAIGGGYATLPFLYHMQTTRNWFTADELTNMIAISNLTPGPIGINMATYTGYTTAGILGSVLATTAIITIPFIIAVTISKIFNKFKNYKWTESLFLWLRPASCSLLTSIGIELLIKTTTNSQKILELPTQIDTKAIILFFIMLIPFSFMKKNPLLAIVAGALGGIILKNF